jgi:hypothetical protein
MSPLFTQPNMASAVLVRIGHCTGQPTDARMLSHWIHPEDLAALVGGVGLELNDNETVYGILRTRAAGGDNAPTLGYKPAHSADGWIEQLRKQNQQASVRAFSGVVRLRRRDLNIHAVHPTAQSAARRFNQRA